jgi:hypothetical protein
VMHPDSPSWPSLASNCSAQHGHHVLLRLHASAGTWLVTKRTLVHAAVRWPRLLQAGGGAWMPAVPSAAHATNALGNTVPVTAAEQPGPGRCKA